MSNLEEMLDYNLTVTGKQSRGAIRKDIEKQLRRDQALEKRKAEIAEENAKAMRGEFYVSIDNIAQEQMDITEAEIHKYFEPHYPDGTPAQDRHLRSDDEIWAPDLEKFLAWKAEARRMSYEQN